MKNIKRFDAFNTTNESAKEILKGGMYMFNADDFYDTEEKCIQSIKDFFELLGYSNIEVNRSNRNSVWKEYSHGSYSYMIEIDGVELGQFVIHSYCVDIFWNKYRYAHSYRFSAIKTRITDIINERLEKKNTEKIRETNRAMLLDKIKKYKYGEKYKILDRIFSIYINDKHTMHLNFESHYNKLPASIRVAMEYDILNDEITFYDALIGQEIKIYAQEKLVYAVNEIREKYQQLKSFMDDLEKIKSMINEN